MFALFLQARMAEASYDNPDVPLNTVYSGLPNWVRAIRSLLLEISFRLTTPVLTYLGIRPSQIINFHRTGEFILRHIPTIDLANQGPSQNIIFTIVSSAKQCTYGVTQWSFMKQVSYDLSL